jgi:predicted TIM-barrel fold metal-dependent hydrolase
VRIFDAHFHIIDPRFPLVPNQGFLPDPFTVADYRDRVGFDGGAVVSASFQAFDQTYLLAALRTLGAGFVGVAQVPASISDQEVLALRDAGVRAFRLNLHRGASLDCDLAWRLWELAGWHVEVYADAATLPTLDVPRLVLDHLGLGPAVLPFVERGAYVKASRFGALSFDVPSVMRSIAAVNPAALLFGSDLPGTRAPRPFEDHDLDLVLQCAGERALWDNAAALYLS